MYKTYLISTFLSESDMPTGIITGLSLIEGKCKTKQNKNKQNEKVMQYYLRNKYDLRNKYIVLTPGRRVVAIGWCFQKFQNNKI